MTRKFFIQVLAKNRYSYEIVGEELIVTYNGAVDLNKLETLPPGVEFKNEGNVWLESLETIPPGVEFKNTGNVYLKPLKTLPPGVEFKNGGDVDLSSLVGGWFEDWKGNIKGINYKRLLNVMISKGIFER